MNLPILNSTTKCKVLVEIPLYKGKGRMWRSLKSLSVLDSAHVVLHICADRMLSVLVLYSKDQPSVVLFRQLQEFESSADYDELELDDCHDETSWESVQQAFDKIHDRCWQLREDDLAICLRPDGSDWLLGKGSFGTVGLMLISLQQTHHLVQAESPFFVSPFKHISRFEWSLTRRNVLSFCCATRPI